MFEFTNLFIYILIFQNVTAGVMVDYNNSTLTLKSLNREKRVIGGTSANSGIFPYQVSLRGKYNGHGYTHFCGGVIISESFILSTAHCLITSHQYTTVCYDSKYINTKNMNVDIIAVVGSNNLHSGGDIYWIESYVIHSHFTATGMYDISLIKLKKPITFNVHIQPISVLKDSVPDETYVSAAGWGWTSFPGKKSEFLQYIYLRTISLSECIGSLDAYISTTQFCTYEQPGKGVCEFDSGGAIVYEGFLIGLISWGKPCAVGYPDVHTKVSGFIDWIERNIYCLTKNVL